LPRKKRDETQRFKLQQGLPNRGSADAQGVANLLLPYPVPGTQAAFPKCREDELVYDLLQ